jgi:hypothetical protein
VPGPAGVVALARQATFLPNVVWNGWFSASPVLIFTQALKQDDFASFRDFYFVFLYKNSYLSSNTLAKLKGRSNALSKLTLRAIVTTAADDCDSLTGQHF